MSEGSGHEGEWVPDELRDDEADDDRRPAAPAPDDWLPPPEGGDAAPGSGPGAAATPGVPDASEWVISAPRPPVERTDEPEEPPEADEPSEPAGDDRVAAERERAAEERAVALEERLGEAERRAERLEAELEDSARARSLAERTLAEAERTAALANERLAAAGAEVRDDEGRVELNTVSVEGLRGLGLSITQAARVVGHREARGGFGSFAELDVVPGLPEEQRAALRERTYLDPGPARTAR
jgi:DNA uptake protein ComE-like DNA-binding protein